MWTLDDRGPTPLWRADRATALLAFTTRRGGVGEPPYDTLNLGRSTEDRPEAVETNRRRVVETLGLDPANLVTAGQVHGDVVTEVTAPGLHPRTDALLTRVPGLILAVTAADCVPVLYDTAGAVCAAHAGWRGVAAGLPATALRAVARAAGVTPDAVSVHIGPSIRECCYEVGDDVAAVFPEAARRRAGDRWRLDLVAAIRLQLREAGVPDSHVFVVPACTACDARDYFSHRRDAGRTGRQWGVAALPARVAAPDGGPV